jgi:hypothetical protein
MPNMEEKVNKYIIVSSVKDNLPEEFLNPDWPLRVTIIQPFFSRDKKKIFDAIEKIMTFGKSREMFRPRKNISVTTIDPTPALLALHEKIFNACGNLLEFRAPPHKRYHPHVTDQEDEMIQVEKKSCSIPSRFFDRKKISGA